MKNIPKQATETREKMVHGRLKIKEKELFDILFKKKAYSELDKQYYSKQPGYQKKWDLLFDENIRKQLKKKDPYLVWVDLSQDQKQESLKNSWKEKYYWIDRKERENLATLYDKKNRNKKRYSSFFTTGEKKRENEANNQALKNKLKSILDANPSLSDEEKAEKLQKMMNLQDVSGEIIKYRKHLVDVIRDLYSRKESWISAYVKFNDEFYCNEEFDHVEQAVDAFRVNRTWLTKKEYDDFVKKEEKRLEGLKELQEKYNQYKKEFDEWRKKNTVKKCKRECERYLTTVEEKKLLWELLDISTDYGLMFLDIVPSLQKGKSVEQIMKIIHEKRGDYYYREHIKGIMMDFSSRWDEFENEPYFQ